MKNKKFFTGIGIVFLFIGILICGFFAFNSFIYNEKQGEIQDDYKPYQGTLSGILTCLSPSKNLPRPETIECVDAIKTDNGEYYSLDFSLSSRTQVEIEYGKRISAWGTITPIENLSSDHWKRYDVKGIFSVPGSIKFD